MTRKQERLAALAAGDELSSSERRLLDQASLESTDVRRLAAELRAQRQQLLTVRVQPLPGGDSGATLRGLRERLAQMEERPRPLGWLAPAGLAAAVLLAAALGWQWTQERMAPAPLPEAGIAAIPEPGLRPAPSTITPPRRESARSLPRPDAVAAVAIRAPRTEAGFAPAEHELQRAMDRVEQISDQPDGTIRLKLRTRNPNVVIYLVQGESTPAEELKETDGVGGE